MSSQSYGFSSGHVWVWPLDYEDRWAPKNWYFWTVVLEKTLESLLDCEEIQPVHPRGDQSWVFIGRTGAEIETPVLWLLDAKNWLICKDPDAGKYWEEDNRGWDGWMVSLMASLTQWTWVWLNSRSWWWTGRPGVLQSMGLQRVGHDWLKLTELAWMACKETSGVIASQCSLARVHILWFTEERSELYPKGEWGRTTL